MKNTNEKPLVRYEGRIIEPTLIFNPDSLSEVVLGDKVFTIAESEEAAGEAARAYWKDMAENDPKEFACIVGEETLIQWGLGNFAGPGATKVRSLEEWLDLTAEDPEETFAEYDGAPYDLYINEAFADEMGWEFKDTGEGWMSVIAYRRS